MLDKFRNALEKHKYFVTIFVFFLVYNFIIVGNFSFPHINELTYTFHIVDFSIGFCPALLPGAIYNALFSTTQSNVVNLYIVILYHLFLLAVSFMLEKFLYKFDSKNRFVAFIIVLFFITGPSTFSTHVVELGMLDTYWLFFAVAFLIMVQNKYLKWFVPIIFALSIFIHVGALISFIPFFALILLLEASKNEKVSKSYIIIFAASLLLAAGTFVCFTAFEESNLTLSLDSFRAFLRERNISEWETSTVYYDYALYRIAPDGVKMENLVSDGEGGFLMQVFGAFMRQIKETFRMFPKIDKPYYVNFASDILISTPIVVFLYKYVLSVYKKEKENKFRRFIWFCALCLLPFTFVTSVLCSPDLIRWFGHGVMCLFALVLYEIYKSSDNDYLEALNNRIKPSTQVVVIIYFVFYMMCTVDPYT